MQEPVGPLGSAGFFFFTLLFLSSGMFQWSPFPFLRITMFFILGIAAGIAFPFLESQIILYLISFSTLLALVYLILNHKKGNPSSKGIIAFILIFCIGFFHSNQEKPGKETSTIEGLFMGRIDNYPEDREVSDRYEVSLLFHFNDKDSTHFKDTRIFLYLKSDTLLRYGDEVLFKGKIYPITPPKNPGEFDYKRFLSYKKIYYQTFLSSDECIRIGNDPPSLIKSTAFNLRAGIEAKIDKYYKQDYAAVVKALVIGLRDSMDDKLTDAYANAGVIHILAVSGLHVGIIYGLLLFALGKLRRVKGGPIIFMVISLTTLWFYAFLTGFSPSVLRAVTMFSFIIIGKSLKREPSIYNSIAGSAFLLLCFDPFLLMQVGFQLSYLAVIGIVYLYDKIIHLWEPPNIVLDKVWKLSVVGIAAQIATCALGFYYFHQFPTYFMLANLLVIPLATGILFSGLLFLAVNWFPVLASLVVFLAEIMIEVMNRVVTIISSLPLSIVGGVYLTDLQLGLFALTIISLIILFTHKRFTYFYIFLGCSLILSLTFLFRYYEQQQRRTIQFYSIRNNQVIDFIANQQGYFHISGNESHEYFTNANRRQLHASLTAFPDDLRIEDNDNSFLQWQGRSLYIVNDIPTSVMVEKADVLYLNKEVSEDILNLFRGKLLLLGYHLNSGFLKKVKAEKSKKFVVHDLTEKAYTLNF